MKSSYLLIFFILSLVVWKNGLKAQVNPNQDFDGDGIINSLDLDDDNDGIPDLLESPPSNTVVNGSFTSVSTPWSLATGWVYSSASGNVSITDNNVSNVDLKQSVNNLNRADGVLALTMTLGAQDGSHASGSTASLQILVNNVVYATISNSTVRNTATNNVTISLAAGVTSSFTPFSTASITGYTFRTFTINIPYNSPGTAEVIFRATTGLDDWTIDDISIPAYILDTDNDGIPNYQDLDSDADGCFDAIEGDENVKLTNISASGVILGAVDSQGIPVLVNSGGAADIGSDQGQGVGSSQSAAVNSCLCYKPAVTAGTVLNANLGITALNRAGGTENWPSVRKGAWTVLEAKTKGFVPNRLTSVQIAGLPASGLVEGMMVYNTTLDCLQINTDGTASGWKCFNTQTCSDVN